MYERLEACPICSEHQLTNKMVVEDHSISKESFVIVECDNCRFQFTNPRPTEAQLPKYYESEDYISHNDSSSSLMDVVYRWARSYMLRKKLKWINSLDCPEKSLLDYGCGTGSFLKVCQQRGWNTTGIEPIDKARNIALANKLEVHSSLDQASINKSFSVISLWHVLEHISNLDEVLGSLKKMLLPHGYLVIALPNRLSYDAVQYKEFWAGYDVPRHLYHFSPDDVKNLARKHKLKIVNTLPLMLDAYYVSLLSARYQKQSLIKAIRTAFTSNKEAKISNNYSSLVYILKK